MIKKVTEECNRKLGAMLANCREKADDFWVKLRYCQNVEDEGIDGILVTVGLCIIALLLCVVMKTSLTTFIQDIVKSMTEESKKILLGTRV